MEAEDNLTALEKIFQEKNEVNFVVKILNEKDNYLVVGTNKKDSIYSSGDEVTIKSGNGNDTIMNDGDNSFLNAGNGNDTVIIGTRENNNTYGPYVYNVTTTGGKGNDKIYFGSFGTSKGIIYGNRMVPHYIEHSVESFAMGNVIKYAPGDGDDTIYGFGESDILEISSSKFTTMTSGNDIIVKVGSGSITFKDNFDYPIKIKAENKELEIIKAVNEIENDTDDTLISGTSGIDSISNSGSYVTINAAGSNDVINNSGNYSILNGGDGNDTISSSSYGEGSYEYYYYGGRHVTLSGGKGNDYLSSGGKKSSLSGGAGNDTLSASGDKSTLLGGNGNDSLGAGKRNSILNGGNGNDSLDARGDKSTLLGGTGNDSLSAGGDKSILNGGDGDDTLYAFGDGSILNGGNGNDTLELYGDKSSTLIGGYGDDYYALPYEGGVTVEYALGDGDDTIAGKNSFYSEVPQFVKQFLTIK